MIKSILDFFNTYFFGPALPWVIFVAGAFLLVKYGSFIIFKPRKVISVLLRKNQESGISPLKTAILALASTLGVGNIVGVSTAIASGGPGAVFWLTLSAFAAMPLKFGEVVLAMKYRIKDGDEYRGGAMYYMRDMLKNKGLSVVFSLLCIICAFTVGNIVQINAVAESFEKTFYIDPVAVGVIGAVVVFFSVRGGAKQISEITAKLIPFATLCFSALSLYIIVTNTDKLFGVVMLVFKEAFNLKAAFGGIGGYAIVRAMRYGVARGILSNEAGCGTSPTAHAKSNLKSPVEQGFWGIFEVFADTVVMCNLTAFVILLSYSELAVGKGLTGMELVLGAFGKYTGQFSEVVITLSVLLFALATIICQCFYGGECVYYLTKNKGVLWGYKVVYCVIVAVGVFVGGGFMWSLTDFTVSVMTVINTVCILLASSEIKGEVDRYFRKNIDF